MTETLPCGCSVRRFVTDDDVMAVTVVPPTGEVCDAEHDLGADGEGVAVTVMGTGDPEVAP